MQCDQSGVRDDFQKEEETAVKMVFKDVNWGGRNSEGETIIQFKRKLQFSINLHEAGGFACNGVTVQCAFATFT